MSLPTDTGNVLSRHPISEVQYLSMLAILAFDAQLSGLEAALRHRDDNTLEKKNIIKLGTETVISYPRTLDFKSLRFLGFCPETSWS